jgi:hypothetical protein
VPRFVPLPFFTLAEAARAHVDFFAFFDGAFDPDRMGDIDVTWE